MKPEKNKRSVAVWLRLAAMILLPLIVYWPSLRGGFLWDDNVLLTDNPFVKKPTGLWSIWFSSKQADYFPLTVTSFWLEWRIWGTNASGYRFTNLLLHCAGAILLWRILLRLKIPGSWLAAMLFAVHPVCVGSVAWIAERKNTLSMVFFLLSLLFYLSWKEKLAGEKGGKGHYYLALLSFVLALLSKTSVVMLPVALLLLEWWQSKPDEKEQRRKGAEETLHFFASSRLFALMPFFLLSLIFGLITIWFQFHHSSSGKAVDTLGLAGKFAAAGQAVWFYFLKAIWPANLAPIYPQWKIDAANLVAYLPALALLVTVYVFWRFRRGWGRHGLFVLGCVVAMLLPILGFIDMYYLTFARVADHWAYLALIPILAFIAGAFVHFVSGRFPRAHWWKIVSAAVIIAFAAVAHERAKVYANAEPLWRDTLAKNPQSWPAHNNLGLALQERGQVKEAITAFETSIRIKPDFTKSHYNLAILLERLGRTDEARLQFQEVLLLDSQHIVSLNHLGNIAATQGKSDEAIVYYERALRRDPNYHEGYNNLANVLVGQGRLNEAIAHYERALKLEPDYAEAENNLGAAFEKQNRFPEAEEHYRKAIALRPAYSQAYFNLASLLLSRDRLAEAKTEFERGLTLDPAVPQAHYNLGLILAVEKNAAAAASHFETALKLKPDFTEARRELDSLLK